MLSCKEVTTLIASDSIRVQQPFQRMMIRVHLMMCHLCRRYALALNQIAVLARRSNEKALEGFAPDREKILNAVRLSAEGSQH